jgi:hypothetical protein
MSLLLLGGADVVAAEVVGPLSLDAVYRTWGTPTDSTARFTIPLAPNHGFTTDDARVLIAAADREHNARWRRRMEGAAGVIALAAGGFYLTRD